MARRLYTFAATRRLSTVDASDSSNQHELGGVAELRRWMVSSGAAPDLPNHRFEADLILLEDDNEPQHFPQPLTLYDARQRKPERAPEWRLYYNQGTPLADLVDEGVVGPGDLAVYALDDTGRLEVVVAPAGGRWERVLLDLFPPPGEVGEQLVAIPREVMPGADTLGAPVALDALGLEPPIVEDDVEWLLAQPEVQDALADDKFPSTHEMAALGRRRAGEPTAGADDLLVAWLDAETRLFFALEEVVAAPRFEACDSVDDYLTVAKSLLQARRSRRGRSLELHLRELFDRAGLPYAFQVVTEPGSKVDFLFPGLGEYRDMARDPATLLHLNAKTTVRERWGQVLKEAERIEEKHLATVDPGLGEDTVLTMTESGVVLVVPTPIASRYGLGIGALSVQQFIDKVRHRIG